MMRKMVASGRKGGGIKYILILSAITAAMVISIAAPAFASSVITGKINNLYSLVLGIIKANRSSYLIRCMSRLGTGFIQLSTCHKKGLSKFLGCLNNIGKLISKLICISGNLTDFIRSCHSLITKINL